MAPKTKWTRKRGKKLVADRSVDILSDAVKEAAPPNVEEAAGEEKEEEKEGDDPEKIEEEEEVGEEEELNNSPNKDDEEAAGEEEGHDAEESEEEGEVGEENEQEEESNNKSSNNDDEEESNKDRDSHSNSRTVSEDIDFSESEDGTTALQPSMYFPPSEYKKKIRISTRCYIHEALTTLENLKPPLSSVEMKWFENHPQFQHIFHLPRDKNHKLMGMWMLLLRTACIEKEREAWFVVNGIPIRYGLREHALISGFECCNYPLDYKLMGSMKFVRKHFSGSTVRHQDVKEKLEGMGACRDRLKMAVLYFLSSIVIARTKCGEDATPVVEFFQRAVDDLELCKTFPWGRLSFDHMLTEISHTMNHFGGVIKEGVLWPIPGFCIPLELLAFEAIPELGSKFRESIPGADMSCPMMCKRRFKKCEMKGFPLSKINEELGKTKDIDSILIARGEEISLLDEITEEDDDNDKHDVVVESWMQCHQKGNTIWFEELYNQDVAARLEDVHQNAENEEITGIERAGNPTFADFAELVNLVHGIKDEMRDMVNEIVDKLDGIDKRVGSLEACVKELGEKSKAPEDPSDDDIAGSIDPPKEDACPSNQGRKKKGVKRTGVDINMNMRVTRSKKNAE